MTVQTNNSTHPSDDDRLDLLIGLLDDEKAGRILDHLAECPACENKFKQQFADQQRLTARVELRRSDDGRLELKKRVGKETRGTGWRWRLLPGRSLRPAYVAVPALAAAALILVVGLLTTPGNNPGRNPWLPAADGNLRVRNEAVSGQMAVLDEGLRAYARHDLDTAIGQLSRAEVTGRAEVVRRVFLGSALLNAGRHDEAAETLLGIADRTVPDPWGVESRWNLYLALAGSGRRAAADSLLRELARENDEAGERARTELQEHSN